MQMSQKTQACWAVSFTAEFQLPFQERTQRTETVLTALFINGQALFISYTNKCKQKTQRMWQETWLVFHSIKQDGIPGKELQSTKMNLQISDLEILPYGSQRQTQFLPPDHNSSGCGICKRFKSENASPIFPSADYFSKGKTWPLLE